MTIYYDKMNTQMHYPEPGKYLNFLKQAYTHLRQGTDYTIKTWWGGDDMKLAEFQRQCRDSLHARINAKGNITTKYREEKYSMERDRHRLNAWLHRPWHQRKTPFGLGLETKYFRDRYPHIDKAMREEFFNR